VSSAQQSSQPEENFTGEGYPVDLLQDGGLDRHAIREVVHEEALEVVRVHRAVLVRFHPRAQERLNDAITHTHTLYNIFFLKIYYYWFV
jgi:hypothetical protein